MTIHNVVIVDTTESQYFVTDEWLSARGMAVVGNAIVAIGTFDAVDSDTVFGHFDEENEDKYAITDREITLEAVAPGDMQATASAASRSTP